MILTVFSIIRTTISVVKTVWPFCREMFFDGKTFWQVLKENKFVTGVLVVLMLSLSLNYVSIRKLVELNKSNPTVDQPAVVPDKPSTPQKEVPTASQPAGTAEQPADKMVQDHLNTLAGRLDKLYPPKELKK